MEIQRTKFKKIKNCFFEAEPEQMYNEQNYLQEQLNRVEGQDLLERASYLKNQAERMPDGELKKGMNMTATEAELKGKRIIANQEYETKRAALEQQERIRATQLNQREAEAMYAKEKIERAGLDDTTSGKRTIDAAENQMREAREAQGRGAEQRYRQGEAILNQEKDDIIVAKDSSGMEARPILPDSRIRSSQELQNNDSELATKIEKGAEATPKSQNDINAAATGDNVVGANENLLTYAEQTGASVTTLALINGIDNPASVQPGDTIDFDIDKSQVLAAQTNITGFINNLNDTVNQFNKGANIYSEGLQIVNGNSIQALIEAIETELNQNQETLVNDATAYQEWLKKINDSLEADEQQTYGVMGNTELLSINEIKG